MAVMCLWVAAAYDCMQWAAVSTHCWLSRVPPHVWNLGMPALPMCRLASQGQLPSDELAPPTTLMLRGAIPQSGETDHHIGHDVDVEGDTRALLNLLLLVSE